MTTKRKKNTLSLIMGIGITAKGTTNHGSLGVLTLQQMKKPGKLGSAVPETNVTGPCVQVGFCGAASIAALIKDLTRIHKRVQHHETSLRKLATKVGVKICLKR